MGKLLLCMVAFCLVSAGITAETQAYLGIFADTTSFKVLGIQGAPEVNEPARNLIVRLWSPGIAKKDASAELTLPEGLKLGQKLKLDIFRQQAEDIGAIEGFNPDAIKDYTIRRYSGSTDTVQEGQPEVIRWDAMAEEQKQILRRFAGEMTGRNAYIYRPNWTTAYWPNAKTQVNIANDASLAGRYQLTTNYLGNTEIEVPNAVAFLPAIEVTTPDATNAVKFDMPITISWKAIPGVQGYHAIAYGRRGANSLIIWDSSDIKDGMNIDWNYLDANQIATLLENKALLASDRTELTIPAGAFKEADIVFLSLVGYGQGQAAREGQLLPRVQTRTRLTLVLGGNAVREGANNANAGGADANAK